MASPFTVVENATATFALPADGVTTDSLGNVIPATTSYEVDLFLKASPQTVNDLPGIEPTTTVLEGYAVDPMALDSRIVKGTTGTISWQGQTWSFDVAGVNERYGITGFIATTLTAYRGDDLRLNLYRQAA